MIFPCLKYKKKCFMFKINTINICLNRKISNSTYILNKSNFISLTRVNLFNVYCHNDMCVRVNKSLHLLLFNIGL